MKKRCALSVWALLLLSLWPLALRAQFLFTTNNGAITITGYTGTNSNVIIPPTINSLPVTSLSDSAFYEDSGLTSVTIPNSVTSIGSSAFNNCSGLTSVTIGSSVTSIGSAAFSQCSGLTSVAIPNSVTSIGNYAFYNCSGLTSVPIPNSVTDIGSAAFCNCSSLMSVTIGSSVTNIGSAAFEYCSILTSVTIPASVTSIGTYAFAYCYGLHKAYFQWNAPIANGGSGSLDTTIFSDGIGTVHYLPGTTSWGATFGGWPTAVWQPQTQLASSSISPTNGFGFNISWASGQTVVVEVSTNLQAWTPLLTNTLASGTNAFMDSTWTHYPQRFYRVRSQ